MFDLSPSMVWLILLVIFILTEIATVGLLTIWFAGGSLAAFFVSLTQAGTGIQIVIFLIVSFVLVLLIRPLAQKKFNSGADSAISSEKIQFRSYPHECPDTDR